MGRLKNDPKTKRPTFIRAWRKFRHLTLDRLSERVGVTIGSLSQLEKGQIGYTQPMLEALADALYCEPADLIMRPPGVENGVKLHIPDELAETWSKIPQTDRVQALKMLKGLAKTGSDD